MAKLSKEGQTQKQILYQKPWFWKFFWKKCQKWL